ncbi:MAG: hypothetical protein E6G60_20715 [Actinobacteria bacterium]|nr:MAG: hypothetical protein E6G60_20715 [Actinomycetota bacterium]
MKNVFTQTITFHSDHPETLIALAREWDSLQASQDAMGFMECRILADRDDPGRYVMINDFGVVDPDVSAAQEAFLNNERSQTQEFAERFLAVAIGEAEWHHYDELYRTSFAGEEIPE